MQIKKTNRKCSHLELGNDASRYCLKRTRLTHIRLTLDLYKEVDDIRIELISPLVPPACIMEEYPITEDVVHHVAVSRNAIQDIVVGKDDRLFAVVGPCSVHDTDACFEYGKKLKTLADEVKDDILIAMRVYFEKPRTTVGWKGLINDPDLDGSFNINKGLKKARKFLLDINSLGLPAAGEFLDTISPQFIADLVSWGAIGARTTESQVHRELASGLSCPVGFKNGTSGDFQVAVDACTSSSSGHSFLSVTKNGIAAIVHTKGNKACHIILRGGKQKTNFDAESVKVAINALEKSGVETGLMIDCSHGNSQKKHKNQPKVVSELAKQVATGNKRIMGVMIESHLNEGNQKHVPGKNDVSALKYGVSITDACIDFETTKQVIHELAKSVRERRAGVE